MGNPLPAGRVSEVGEGLIDQSADDRTGGRDQPGMPVAALSAGIEIAAASVRSAVEPSAAELSEFAALLLRRYGLTGVDGAIEIAERAVTRGGSDRRGHAAALTTLANARAAAFQEWGRRDDMTAAVAAQREAVVLLDPVDPDRPALEVNLADRLLSLHGLAPSREIVEEAVRLGQDALPGRAL